MEARLGRLLGQISWVGVMLGTVATIYFLFGQAGYVHYLPLNLAVALVEGGAAVFFLWHFLNAARGTGWIGWSIWAAILLIIVAQAALGVLPPTSRDELTHHLAIPKLYAQAGRIIEVPFAPYAYYPMLLDMLYTPWLHWGYDFVPKWLHGLYGLLTGLMLYAYLGRRMNGVYGLLGGFFFLSTPVILRLSHWGYIDLGIAFYSTATLLCLLRWREQRHVLGWLALAGLSLGFALATKPNGMVVALSIGLLFLLVLAKPPRKDLRGVAVETALFGALAILPFLPWLVKNWSQTGNPFFPFFGGFFTVKGQAGFDSASFAGLGIFAKRALLYGESGWQIAALPLRLFFFGQDDNPQYFDGVLTPFLILLLPWAFKGKWLEEKRLLGGFALLSIAYAMFLVDMRIRYVLPVLAPLVILFVYGVFNIYTRIKRPAILFAVLLLCAGWHGVYLWKYFTATQPLAYWRGAESREDYLLRLLPEYEAFQHIKHASAADAKIYLLFVGRRAYYCERNYFHDGGDLPGFLLTTVRAAQDAEQIAQRLRKKQITHLLMREDLLAGFLSENLTAEQARRWREFATSRLKLEFRARGHSVYRLHG